MRTVCKPLFASLLLAGLSLSALASAPGALDSGFGTGGKAVTDAGGNDRVVAIRQLADGKLVVAGYGGGSKQNFAVLRYNTNGKLDQTFGSGGGTVTSLDAYDDRAMDLAVLPSGKLVAAGYSNNGVNDDFALVRYTASGAVDSSFGSGGYVRTAVGNSDDRAFAVLDDSGGSKLLVAGFSDSGGLRGQDFALLRYQANGALDTSFKAISTDLGGDDAALSMIRQRDGKLVLAGLSAVRNGVVYDNYLALARYTAGGALDSDFAGTGAIVTRFEPGQDAVAQAVIQQADGKLVVVGNSRTGSDSRVGLVRYLANGEPDNHFGTGGAVVSVVSRYDDARAVIQQADGKLLVAGSTFANGIYNFFLARFTADGIIDSGFGNYGVVITPVGSVSAGANAMLMQADGQVVSAGYSNNGPGDDVALVRYLFDDDDGDGVLDTTDNCPVVSNADQLDTDHDGKGNACDDDDDNDGVPDSQDAFPLDPTESVDTDGDGIGNNADTDDDGDGIDDINDPYPLDANLLDRASGDNRADALGSSVANVGDANNDGCDDFLIGAPKDDPVIPPGKRPVAGAGSAYLYSGCLVNQQMVLLHAFTGERAGDNFGVAVAAAGDVDGDGVPDFIVGADKADVVDAVTHKRLTNAGMAIVYSGRDYSELMRISGEAAGDGLGMAVSAAGDVDGDGSADVLVGAPKADIDNGAGKTLKDAGAAYLYSGKTHVLLHKFSGKAGGDGFGSALVVGSDLDHDGVPELAIGAWRHNTVDSVIGRVHPDAGSVYVYSEVAPYSQVIQLDGNHNGDNFGFSLAVTDVGNDAFADLAVGAPMDDVSSGGRVYSNAGSVSVFADTTGKPLWAVTGDQAGSRFGSALARAGDINADGVEELLVAAPREDVFHAGRMVADAGQVSVLHADAGAVAGSPLGGAVAGAQYGFAVAGGGDQNGDGVADLIIGIPMAANGSKPRAGMVHVLSGAGLANGW